MSVKIQLNSEDKSVLKTKCFWKEIFSRIYRKAQKFKSEENYFENFGIRILYWALIHKTKKQCKKYGVFCAIRS